MSWQHSAGDEAKELTGVRIPGWTDAQSRVAIAGAVALMGSATAVAEATSLAVLVVVAVAITFVVSLAGDAWFGLVVGLALAALLTFARQQTGNWLPSHFLPAAVESAALLLTGLTAGRVGRHLRVRAPSTGIESSPTPGVFGSLGLLPGDLGLLRLEEEVARASAYERPLSLMLMEIHIVAQELERAARAEAERGVARLVESLLRDTDVPFALAAHQIGAILPETDAEAAAVATARILEAIAVGSFTDRGVGQRRRLADVASLHMVEVSLGDEFPGAGELLDGAIARLHQMRKDP